jgi:hypothetical protein
VSTSRVKGVVRISLVATLAFCLFACGRAPRRATDEQVIERQLARPSVSAHEVHITLTSITFERSPGMAPRGAAFVVTFRDDDTAVYTGLSNVPRIGRFRAHFPFAELAAWFEAQPQLIGGDISLPGMVDGGSLELVLTRATGPPIHIRSGFPVTDPYVWGAQAVVEAVVARLGLDPIPAGGS